ncbi:hypothetical protein [Corynebacterium durum]|uniref:hypothetical protein n=1 Tax=Corynebacterium durum TaxID=61592 RepID=UPI0015C9EC69|nr:hypothetical protein [Corynebacterium durum]NYI73892.1 hypothetical protein [Corynebacterium durum]WJY85615.1 hypothetical protein CDUR_09435 [Corynebacterium durum]
MRALPTPAKVAIVGGLSAALLGTGAAMAWAQNSSTDAKSTTSSQSVHHDDASVALDSTKAREDLGSRLDKAVTDGKITSKDKDAVLKAFDAGVLGGEEIAIEFSDGGDGNVNDSTKTREDLTSRLDKAVTDGKITSKDKDAVLKAFNADVFGGEEMAIEIGEGGHGPFGGFRDDSK